MLNEFYIMQMCVGIIALGLPLAKLMAEYYDRDNELAQACRDGDEEKAKLLVKNGGEPGSGFIGACQAGRIDMADLMISYGANNWNGGLERACEWGHRGMIEFILYRAKTELNYNFGLAGACKGGQRKIAELMLAYGATNTNWGFSEAVLHNHKELVLLMIIKGVNRGLNTWSHINLTTGDITHLVLNGVRRFTDRYEIMSCQCIHQVSITLYKMLSIHLVDDLITIFFQYIF